MLTVEHIILNKCLLCIFENIFGDIFPLWFSRNLIFIIVQAFFFLFFVKIVNLIVHFTVAVFMDSLTPKFYIALTATSSFISALIMVCFNFKLKFWFYLFLL